MKSTVRRKPLALFLFYSFASVLVGAYADEAQAQAPVPLRVDPVLLGLPPIKPAEAPAPAAVPAPAEKARVEVRPIEPAVVETRPAVPPAAPIVSVPPAPVQAQPVSVSPGPASAVQVPAKPAQASAPTPVTATQSATKPGALAPAASTPLPVASSASSGTVSALAPLRVDPALLGLPPVAASGTTSQASAARAATSPATGDVLAAGRVSGATKSVAFRKSADADKSWYQRLWSPIANAYDKGDWEFYLPLHTHHLRSQYSAEKIATYQETPYGFGLGSGLYNEHGNWEGVYAMAFQDSHFKPMYMAGYGWKAIWRPAEDVRLGLGYTAALMSRTDILGYVPFPIVLPMASVAYKSFSLEGTFVPGGKGFGNIFFIWAKWELGKSGQPVGTPAHPEQPKPTELANTSFGPSTPVARQRVPYGPVLEPGPGSRLAAPAETVPPLVASRGMRDEEEVPDVLPALALLPAKTMLPPPKESPVSRPVFLSAYRMGGDIDREFVAEGDAELRKIGTVVNSDRLTYWQVDDEIEAEGNVRLEQGGSLITGPKMRLKLEDQVGFFEQPSYLIKRQPQPGSQAAADKAFAAQFLEQQGDSWNSGFALPRSFNQTSTNLPTMAKTMSEGRGEADRIDFEGENQVRLTNGSYTTCAPGNNDWYAKAGDLKLDYDHETGEGKDGTLYFMDVPVLYSPWLSFSLNNARKSGFLAPSFGATSDSGFSIRQPYYWNIAPNMDATISPRVLTKRGVLLSSEFRYLNTAFGGGYRGEARIETLPSDKLREGDSRYGFSLTHSQELANGFSGLINYNKVSDNNYFTDLSSNVVSTSQSQLMQQGMVSYGGGGWWNATANFQNYQTLQPDPKNPVLEQYRMLPQITVNARKPDWYLTDSSFMGQYTSFSKPKQVINGNTVADPDGQRIVLYPQVALPYVTPGWYVTPKLGLNIRHYALDGLAPGQPDSFNSTLPVASIDSGMTFERASRWFGRDYTQTLEPRLFYLNIPYKNQDRIPLFDSGLADFNFAQIFSENQFSGWDRINNANQLTVAATTRLLEPATGSEIMRAMFGQRFYFSKNQVALAANPAPLTDDRKWDKSDFLAAFSGQVLPRVYADVASQYNFGDRQVKRYSMGARYQPEPGKVLNAAYRYNRDATAPIDQVDFSGQWPISGRWHGVGRLNYSFKDPGTNLSASSQGGRLIQTIAGLEYNGGCWVVRGVFQRLALTQDKASTGFFIQLELNDFASIGSNPVNLLRRNVQGYSLINQPVADPVFGQ